MAIYPSTGSTAGTRTSSSHPIWPSCSRPGSHQCGHYGLDTMTHETGVRNQGATMDAVVLVATAGAPTRVWFAQRAIAGSHSPEQASHPRGRERQKAHRGGTGGG